MKLDVKGIMMRKIVIGVIAVTISVALLIVILNYGLGAMLKSPDSKELAELKAGSAECSQFYFQSFFDVKYANEHMGANYPLDYQEDWYRFHTSAFDLLSEGRGQDMLTGTYKADVEKGGKVANDFFSYLRNRYPDRHLSN